VSCGGICDAASLRSQLAEVEKKIAADPNLWSDPEKSQVLMRQRKRLEDTLTTDADLARRVGDISAYFELAREGEAVTDDLRNEIASLRELAEKLQTQTLLSGENGMRNPIVTTHPGAVRTA